MRIELAVEDNLSLLNNGQKNKRGIIAALLDRSSRYFMKFIL